VFASRSRGTNVLTLGSRAVVGAGEWWGGADQVGTSPLHTEIGQFGPTVRVGGWGLWIRVRDLGVRMTRTV